MNEIKQTSLEKAAENYIAPIENDEGLDYINFNGQEIKDAFKAGAEWQYQKDRGEFAKLKAKEWSDGYDEGIAKGKEQMMKNAVDYKIVNNLAAYPVIYYEVDHLGLKYGDKVKMIILKDGE